MDTQDLSKRVKELFSKGAEASKEAFEKAGDKVQTFTDKSVNKIEKKQLESKLNSKYEELGELVSSILDNKDAVTFKDEKVTAHVALLQKEIKSFQKQIKAKEEEI